MTNIWKNLTKNIKHGLKVLKKLVILLANKLIQEDKKKFATPTANFFMCNLKVKIKNMVIIIATN